MNYENIIHALIDSIVEDPQSILIRVAGKSENKHIHLKFESFEEEKVGD